MHDASRLIAAMMLTLTGCATHIPVPSECAPPPQLPKYVRDQADQQRPTYSDRARPLLQSLETQIETAPR